MSGAATAADRPPQAARRRWIPWTMLIGLGIMVTSALAVSLALVPGPPVLGAATFVEPGRVAPLGITGFVARPSQSSMWLGTGLLSENGGPLRLAVVDIQLIGFPGVPVPRITNWEIAWIPPHGGPSNASGYGWPPRSETGIRGTVQRVAPTDGFYTWRYSGSYGHNTYRDLTLALGVRRPARAREFGYQAVDVTFQGVDGAIHDEILGDGWLICEPNVRLPARAAVAACDQRFSQLTQNL